MEVNAVNLSSELNSLQDTPATYQLMMQILQELSPGSTAYTDLEEGQKTGNYTAFQKDIASIESSLANVNFSNVAPALQNTVQLMLQNLNDLASASSFGDPNGVMYMFGQTAMCAQIIANSLAPQ